jgi:hypothetical protein
VKRLNKRKWKGGLLLLFSRTQNERISDGRRIKDREKKKKDLAWTAGYVWKDFLTSLNVVPISTDKNPPSPAQPSPAEPNSAHSPTVGPL